MTDTAPATAEQVRADVRVWLDENWDAELPYKEWLEKVVDSGWAAPSWSTEWFGRGLDPAMGNIVAEEFNRVGAPGTGQDKVNLWANTMVAWGTDALKAKHLRDLMFGDVGMCLLYSEPGAGSDLAGIQTRAVRDGDEWIVNGQKVWTSSGRSAEFALLIARTDWDVPKHRGITFFWFPMKQDGVEVRPLRQATGDARFNEVFITDARVPHENILGDENNGWMVLTSALAYERAALAEDRQRGRQRKDSEAVRSSDDEAAAPAPDLSLIDLAREMGKLDDPIVRQQLMRLRAMVTVNQWNMMRAKAEMEQGTSSSVVSLGKLAMSGILHFGGSLQTEILGAEGTIGGNDSPRAADATYALLNAFFTSIGGGTDQIQRNIIGERILGLPKEPELDKHQPFREVLKSPATTRG